MSTLQPLKEAFMRHAGQRVFFADTRSDVDVKEILRYAVRALFCTAA
jgi:hypothetical protein